MENPLDPSRQTLARIIAKAKEMWEADGKPACGPEAYREAATDIIGMEMSGPGGQMPVDPPVPLGPEGQPVEEAWLQENLGDPGGSMNELGDKREVPFATRAEEEKALKDEA
ncbi:hypothetical protein [Acidomonas methanolica]|uniref:hypothetical protein n=1 Tax=Acidomonas methanolica TaxID=437 RepID=UPI00211A031E|nr:hypothetical protein [Acidomonas methanolica]MCQ9155098.1 hypothetical protein [Acidomonas methanolica]